MDYLYEAKSDQTDEEILIDAPYESGTDPGSQEVRCHILPTFQLLPQGFHPDFLQHLSFPGPLLEQTRAARRLKYFVHKIENESFFRKDLCPLIIQITSILI